MIENLFTSLTMAMNDNIGIALSAAMGWGSLSIILSPCHLTSIPLVIGYLSNKKENTLKTSAAISLVFSVGILISIAIIGLVTALLGRLMGDVGSAGNIIVAAIFILMGLYLMDIMPLPEFRFFSSSETSGGYLGALSLGLIFGIGLGPCTFAFMAPVLGVVFQLASTALLKSLLLIFAFALGHCLVIIIAGSSMQLFRKYMKWEKETKLMLYIKRLSGFLVFLGGIYFLYTLN